MIIEHLEQFLLNENIPFETHVNLQKKTWIHRGGIADYYVIPKDVLTLEKVISYLYRNNISHLVVGCTSNLYILNTTSLQVVVSTLKCSKYLINEHYIECDCGVQVSRFAREMIKKGIKGFEYLTKLPGTIGAAIYNNSSVKRPSCSITELLIDIDVITQTGVRRLNKEQLNFGFRTSDLKKHILEGVILKARLRLEYGDKEELMKTAINNETERNKLLEGPAQTLGCTVHKMFSNGKMPLMYRIPFNLFTKLISFFVKDTIERKKYTKRFLLTITGYKHLLPYVSDKQLITFIWKDEKADDYFDDYLMFMREICKTNQVEIEII